MTQIPEPLQDTLDAFRMMEDRQERVQALIDMADHFKPVPERVATPPFPEAARVPHCESEAFAFVEPGDDGTLRYHFAIENPQGVSAMAMAAIIDRTMSGQAADSVLAVQPDVIYDLFGRELSMGKSAGLMGMIQMVHALTRRSMQGQGAGCDRGEIRPQSANR